LFSETQPNQAALLLNTMPIQPGSQRHQLCRSALRPVRDETRMALPAKPSPNPDGAGPIMRHPMGLWVFKSLNGSVHWLVDLIICYTKITNIHFSKLIQPVRSLMYCTHYLDGCTSLDALDSFSYPGSHSECMLWVIESSNYWIS
jgi:hypothetical protein